MTVGERIRQARLAAGQTQAELAGDGISRNMLSRIEHDKVNPSLSTLTYIADRLHIPPGILLGSAMGDEENRSHMELLRLRFHEGDDDTCIAIGQQYFPHPDDEAAFLLCECCYRRARRRFHAGACSGALEDFLRSDTYAAMSAYPSPRPAESRVYESILRRLLTTDQNENDAAAVELPPLAQVRRADDPASEPNRIETALLICRLMEEGKITAAESLLRLLPTDAVEAILIQALLLREAGDYTGAAQHLEDLLLRSDIGEILRLISWHLLERIYADQLDYRNAYRSARNVARLRENCLK